MTPTLRASLVPALLLALLAACESRTGAGDLDLDADGSAGDDASGDDGGDGGVNPDGGDGGPTDGGDADATDTLDPDGTDTSDPDGSGGDTGDTGTDPDADVTGPDATDDTSDVNNGDTVDPDAADSGDTAGTDTTDPGDTTGTDTTDPGDTTGTDTIGADTTDPGDTTGTDTFGADTADPGDTTGTDTIGADTTDPGDTTADVAPDAAVPCGNGVINVGEACDGANLNGESCFTLGFVSGDLACASCAFDTTACSSTDICGDNIVGDSEECDIGDDLDGDGCTAMCLLCTEDDAEPNDLLTQYRSVSYPSSNAFVSQTGDLDYFRVLLGPGCALDATIEFDVSGPALGATAYTSGGTELATGVDSAAGIELDWSDPMPGFSSQYVLIKVEGLDEGGCVDYTVVVRARCG